MALLHGMTSHSLQDQYTDMTGMERAFQLLHSAGSWSDQPYDSISLDILEQIATLSPKVNNYPEHITCSIKIEWNSQYLPYSVQHFGYYLLPKKLVETSEEWKFMHPSTETSHPIHKLFQNNEYNEKVLIKLYWDYRDSYNPTVRLSSKMEQEIRSTTITKSYQPVWINSSPINDHNSYQLKNEYSGDLYLRDSSSLDCFPLSKWLKDEPKQVWIDLFKLIEELKTKQSPNQQDDLQRLEILFDFLRYISPKHNTQPIYFQ